MACDAVGGGGGAGEGLHKSAFGYCVVHPVSSAMCGMCPPVLAIATWFLLRPVSQRRSGVEAVAPLAVVCTSRGGRQWWVACGCVAVVEGVGGQAQTWHKRIHTGVSSSMQVTLSRNADVTATPIPSRTIRRHGSPLEKRSPYNVTFSNAPVLDKICDAVPRAQHAYLRVAAGGRQRVLCGWLVNDLLAAQL